MTAQRQPKHFIQSLARGMAMLQAFSADRPRLTLQQLAQATGFNKTAVQRLTDTLLTLGFLGRNRYKEYFLEPRVLSLGFAYLNGSELRHLAATHLPDFSVRLGRTVNLAVLEGQKVVIIYRREVQTFFNFNLTEGSDLPAHCTALGKVLLAGLEPDDLAERIGRMELQALTSRTITDPEALMDEVAKTRARGYGFCDQEGSLALCSVAVPLFDRNDRTVAAINLSLPVEDVRGEQFGPLLTELQAEGHKLSRLLGYSGPFSESDPIIKVGD